jgi:hypothetical protein
MSRAFNLSPRYSSAAEAELLFGNRNTMTGVEKELTPWW